MNKENAHILDQWEEALEVQITVLQSCQSDHGFETCFLCDELFSCDTRKKYIKAVYESMNKGSGGGFEF